MKKYIMIKDDRAYCGNCGKNKVFLLCPDDIDTSAPAFYVCDNCKAISQVAVGPINWKIKSPPPPPLAVSVADTVDMKDRLA